MSQLFLIKLIGIVFYFKDKRLGFMCRILLFTILMAASVAFPSCGEMSQGRLGLVAGEIVVASAMVQGLHQAVSYMCQTPLKLNDRHDIVTSVGVVTLSTMALFNILDRNAENSKVAAAEATGALAFMGYNIARKMYQKKHRAVSIPVNAESAAPVWSDADELSLQRLNEAVSSFKMRVPESLFSINQAEYEKLGHECVVLRKRFQVLWNEAGSKENFFGHPIPTWKNRLNEIDRYLFNLEKELNKLAATKSR